MIYLMGIKSKIDRIISIQKKVFKHYVEKKNS